MSEAVKVDAARGERITKKSKMFLTLTESGLIESTHVSAVSTSDEPQHVGGSAYPSGRKA